MTEPKEEAYEVILMRGTTYYVKANSESEAYAVCRETYPEMQSADILDIRVVKDANI